ncbi:MAG: hypothetical protein WC558_10620 [Patulibacter sp.]
MRPGTVEPFGLLQNALEVYRKHFGVLFPVSLIVGLIQGILLLGLGSDDPTKLTTGDMIASTLGLLPTLVFLAFTVELLRDVRAGEEVRPTGELLRRVLSILLPLLVIGVVASTVVGIGLILLVVPGLFLMTIWAVVVQVYVIERGGIGASFDRSRALVRGYGWPVFGTALLVVLISLLGVIIGAIVSIDPTTIAGSFVQLVITSLVTPATMLMMGLLYFRLVDLHDTVAAEPQRDAAHDAFGVER